MQFIIPQIIIFVLCMRSCGSKSAWPEFDSESKEYLSKYADIVPAYKHYYEDDDPSAVTPETPILTNISVRNGDRIDITDEENQRIQAPFKAVEIRYYPAIDSNAELLRKGGIKGGSPRKE